MNQGPVELNSAKVADLIVFTGVCDDPQILCPVCGGAYVRPGTPVFMPGYAVKESEYCHTQAPDWIRKERDWVRNGTENLPFRCDNGCQFALQFGEHQGYTFFGIVIGPQREDDPGNPEEETP